MPTLAGIEVRAISVGGLETCIEIPSWRLAFDIGRCPPTAARLRRICFTHAHVDHMGGVAHHVALRDLWGMSPPEYLVPHTEHEAFEAMLAAWRRLDRSELPCSVRPVRPGDDLRIGKGRRIRVFRSVHRAPTVGYALISDKERLRPELRGLPGPEIAARRARGERITEPVETVEVVFCGDTTIDVVDREEIVRRARLLVLECTFLDERVTVERSRRTGHVHLDEIVARADRFENEAILLTHFSVRYSPQRILEVLDERLPPGLRDRVVPLLPGPPWRADATPDS